MSGVEYRCLLPGEVWSLVFRLLSFSDRLGVRSTCKYFRELVDNDLWRGRTVELRRDSEEDEEHFWAMLRRWGVTSASLCPEGNWPDVAKELPGLTTLKINTWYFHGMPDLRGLTNLESLELEFQSHVSMEELSSVLPQRLTKLTVLCHSTDTCSLPTEIPPDSPFKKLKSLIFHCAFDSHPIHVLHFFLSSLPQLQHISLLVFICTGGPSFEGHISDLPPLRNCSLSSLELWQCDTRAFPMDFMKMFSPLFLRSLAIYCSCYNWTDDGFGDDSLKLSAWLQDLPALTSLLVECKNMAGFARSIPSTVTRLVLLPHYIDSEGMTALSVRLPNLRHLYLEVLNDPDDPVVDLDDLRLSPVSEIALIPQLFPGLRTLRLCHVQVSKDVFLSLASLKKLQVLEILPSDRQHLKPPPSALISELRALTNNRFQIYNTPESRWFWPYGSSYLPAGYWVEV